MLFFSETDLTLSDMATVYDEFDAEYDRPKYERKITPPTGGAYKHAWKGARETCDKMAGPVSQFLAGRITTV